MIAPQVEWNARLSLVLFLLGMLEASSASVRAAAPDVRSNELAGAYIGTRDSQPLWVLIEKVTTTKDACSFQYTRVEANSIRKGTGTATDGTTRIFLGEDLEGIIKHDQADPHSVILAQEFKGRRVWRLQKIDRKSSVTNGSAGQFPAASRLADDAITALLSVRGKLLESVRRPAEFSKVSLATDTLSLLDEYIAKKVASAPPKVVTRVLPPAEQEGHDAAIVAELDTVKRQLGEARDELEREIARRQTEEGERRRLTEVARTGYYTVMPYDDLARGGLISRDGAFGAVRLRDFRIDSFQKIDIEELKELPLPYRIHRLELLTPHPPASYKLIPISGGKTLLRVLDREAFWRGRFLVIGVR